MKEELMKIEIRINDEVIQSEELPVLPNEIESIHLLWSATFLCFIGAILGGQLEQYREGARKVNEMLLADVIEKLNYNNPN